MKLHNEGRINKMEQITWEQFIIINNDTRGVNYKFEDLCRQLFTYEYLAHNVEHKYVHSNPNNAGIESEPILDEKNHKYIGYQAKFFENRVGYKQIEESAKKAIEHYKGKLDIIYLYCNKSLTTTCQSYKNIKKMLNDADILLKPITDATVLDLVRKYPDLAKYYFNNHGISHEWLVNQAHRTIDVLGERFNADFNIDTVASKNLTVFLQTQKALDYYNNKKRGLIQEIYSLRCKLDDLYQYAHKLSEFISTLPDVNFDCIHNVENWQDIISSKFEADLNEIESKILNTKSEYEEVKDNTKNNMSLLKNRLSKLEKLKELYFRLELSQLEKKLLNGKILVVEGEAGIGKTQLFANETTSLLNVNENALLIIGSDCLSDHNIFEQLKNNLRLNFEFEDLIDMLEVLGKESGKIIPIFIDALNESWNPELWKSVLPILYRNVNNKDFVRLAISFRNEYQKSILPDHFLELENVMKIDHLGFRRNSFDAAKRFLDYYGIPFTPLHMFTSNINNPLFLTLYCKTYEGDEVELPVLYERLLEKVNDKLHTLLAHAISSAGYDRSDNIVLPIVEAISQQTLNTGKRHFEKNEVALMPIWNTMGLAARPFITKLIRENILQDYELKGKNYVYFTYDQMNDYFSAKAILSEYQTKEEIRKYILENVLDVEAGKLTNTNNEGLFVHVCALYAKKFKEECIDIIAVITDEMDREDLFGAYIKSFEWRDKIYLTISELLKLCDEHNVDPSIIWNVFMLNSLKKEHRLNADSLHDLLMNFSLTKRDYLWTIFINGLNSDNDRIVQLIETYNKGKLLEISDKEQIRLLLILFSWLLTSSNRWLRDITSKAMIEILKEYFEYSEYLLKLFALINDPYVIQRLYGIIFGACVKRKKENMEVYKSLVSFVFDEIFNKPVVYPDILLRDYARLIVERFVMEYPNETQNYDLEKIKPLYKSIPIPDIGDQKYSKKIFHNGLYYIQCSMRFEGIGMYGDFGRYVFQSALRAFDVDNYKIFNYAMYYIINELNYQSNLFDDYDKYVSQFAFERHRTIKIERIGKKYQWIAMYNILARISDYYPMKNNSLMEDVLLTYNGPCDPYVKDFDPTLNENNLIATDSPYFSQIDEHIRKSIQENADAKSTTSFNEKAWINSSAIFFEYQKEDLLLTDGNGNQWIVLSKYADTGKNDLEHDKLLVWNWLYGYFVNVDQLTVLRKYAAKKMNFLNSDISSIPETYILYNREYPWSSGSKSIANWQWKNIEIKSDKTEQLTKTFEEPQLSVIDDILNRYSSISGGEKMDLDEDFEIPTVKKVSTSEEKITIDVGNILSTSQYLLWEEEFDASKENAISCSHPCAEIINDLNLKQKKYDGYYYDEFGILTAFDTDLTKQKAGLVIRKDALDKFLKIKNYHLVWFINASKEVYDDKRNMISSFTDWTGLLEYTNDNVEGEYYIIRRR